MKVGLSFILGLLLALSVTGLLRATETPPRVSAEPVLSERVPAATPVPKCRSTTQATSEQPAPPVAHLPADLLAAEALISHFYGEPTPWDSDQARQLAEHRFETDGERLETNGTGALKVLDCESYPCVAVVEVYGPYSEAMGALSDVFDDMSLWQISEVETNKGPGWQLLLEQVVEDVSTWDSDLQRRKMNLSVRSDIDALEPLEHADAPIEWASPSDP